MELLLDAYTDFLMICPGQASATFMSDILAGSVSHDQITRLLSSGKVNSQALWKMTKPICHEVQSNDGVLIVDDSILPKPHSRVNGLVCWHYDHTKGRTVKSINFLSAIYHSQGMSVPVGIETVIKDKIYTDNKGKVKRRNTISKHEQFRSLIIEATEKMPVQYVLADTWYSSADNMNYIVKVVRTNFILGCKENRRIALSLEDKKAGRYQLIKEMAPEEHARTVWLEQLDFPVVLTRQVFIHEDGSCGILYLVSSDLRLNSEQIATIYQRRWKVEEFYKSIKGNTSVGSSPAWKIGTQRSHLIASVMAFVKLEVLKERHNKNHFAIKKQLFRYAARAAWQNLGQLQLKSFAA
jgi:hypothetical protein